MCGLALSNLNLDIGCDHQLSYVIEVLAVSLCCRCIIECKGVPAMSWCDTAHAACLNAR